MRFSHQGTRLALEPEFDMAEPTPPRRKRTARFIEIARAAGVSPATVDRVLNERGSVSAAARARVVAAARQLGVPRVLPETSHGLMHIDVLLPQDSTPFFGRLNIALQRSVQMLDRRIMLHRQFLPCDDDNAITDAILHPPHRRAGLIVTTRDTPPVRDALREVIEHGERVVTMMTDVADIDRLHYAGIDNLQAGRTAGYFVGRFAPRAGRVLLLCGHKDYRKPYRQDRRLPRVARGSVSTSGLRRGRSRNTRRHRPVLSRRDERTPERRPGRPPLQRLRIRRHRGRIAQMGRCRQGGLG